MRHRFCWMAVRMLGSVLFEPIGLIHILQNDPDALGHVLKRELIISYMDRPDIIGCPCLPDKINLPGFPAERSSIPHILSGTYTRMRSTGARCYIRRPTLG
jgi:hypothetical protein